MKKNEKRVPINARLTVLSINRLSQNLIRICFSSDKTLTVNPLWIGPHLKLLFADPKTNELVFPDYDENNKIIWQDGMRQRVRTYSVRHYDVTTNQLMIDFVVHQTGIATLWAQQAKVGDQVGLVGMGAKCKFDDSNVTQRKLVLIGDISAMPTICYTIENMPKDCDVAAFIEVNDSHDVLQSLNEKQRDIHWIVRKKGEASQLMATVIHHDFMNNEQLFFWGGVESTLAQQMRHALDDKYPNLASDAIQIISYWREGCAEGEFRHRE
ncbi:siderophore-interacting protein [Orbaceae bacterium ESL0727]|nr:siderophore-interacting protein [Orbaceae bacterium ESL0727]